MEKATKKNKEDIKRWLLSFEKRIGGSVVVSLLIQDGSVSFISCVSKRRYLGEADDDEDPSIDLSEVLKGKGSKYAMNVKDYIG